MIRFEEVSLVKFRSKDLTVDIYLVIGQSHGKHLRNYLEDCGAQLRDFGLRLNSRMCNEL